MMTKIDIWVIIALTFFQKKDLIFHLQEPINLNLGNNISFDLV